MFNINFSALINSVVFSVIGIVILLIFYFIIEKMTPEHTWREISQNKNSALAIIFGALIIAIALIISAAIHG